MHSLIADKREVLADLCRRLGVRRLEVFGSGARGTDFDVAASDADFLVTWERDVRPTITRLLDLEESLAAILGRDVDLVDREALEQSRNDIRRRQILAEAVPLYEA